MIGSKKKLWFAMAMFFLLIFAVSNMMGALADDVPAETGVISEVGDNSFVIVIKNGNGFKDGTKLTFYLHKKTKIVMAESKTPLTLSSLLVGDYVRITLGVVEEDEKGNIKRYVNRVDVLGGKKRLRLRRRKLRNKAAQ